MDTDGLGDKLQAGFQNPARHRPVGIVRLAEPAARSVEAAFDFGDRSLADTLLRKMRRKPQGTEELLVGRNRPLDTLLVGTAGDTPDTLAVLQEFAATYR